jgi:hypothetical protein
MSIWIHQPGRIHGSCLVSNDRFLVLSERVQISEFPLGREPRTVPARQRC